MIALLDTNDDLATCAAELQMGVGQLITPITRRSNRVVGTHMMFAIDNGAFGRDGFDLNSFLSLLEREKVNRAQCLFVVAPDVVGCARRTLESFAHWRCRLDRWPLAIACQDGQENLPIPWDDLSAVFIGGSTKFKLSKDAEDIIRCAKCIGKWTHVGRVNTPDRIEKFMELGVDSIDGSGIAMYTHMRRKIGESLAHPRLEFADCGEAGPA
jgi:hypothetical protein